MAKTSNFLKRVFYYLHINDSVYAWAKFFYTFHHTIKFKFPKTLNEKLHWMNLSGYLDAYSSLADKYAVRDFVGKRAGKKYLNKLYGVYKDVSEINFGDFPRKFVLKATHGSSWNIICKDRSEFNEIEAKKQLKNWLELNYYCYYRERIYKNITPRVICERFLESKKEGELIEYKILCFDGRAEFINLLFYKNNVKYTGDYYDRNWRICPFIDGPYYYDLIEKPEKLDEMIHIAESLSKGIPFVRVDLYNFDSEIIFGEMTFLPAAGFGIYLPEEWDSILGSYLQLPSLK